MAMSTDACQSGIGGAFLCRTGHLCVKPGFLCQTMHFAVEPGFLVSNECYNHFHGSHRGFYAKEIQLQCEHTGAMPPSHQAIDVRISEMFLIFIILSQNCGCWWPVALLFQDRPATATVLVSINRSDMNRMEHRISTTGSCWFHFTSICSILENDLSH